MGLSLSPDVGNSIGVVSMQHRDFTATLQFQRTQIGESSRTTDVDTLKVLGMIADGQVRCTPNA